MIDDEQQFVDLVRRQRRALRAYVARRVPPADVDDVVSEVFATAWRLRDQVPGDDDELRMWLFRTAWHALLHQFRSARRRERLGVRLAREPVVEPGTSARSEGDRVRAALARLRPSDQELLRLTYWEQLTAEQVAGVVGGTPGAVRVRLHRARRRLAAVLPASSATAAVGRAGPAPGAGPVPTSCPTAARGVTS